MEEQFKVIINSIRPADQHFDFKVADELSAPRAPGRVSIGALTSRAPLPFKKWIDTVRARDLMSVSVWNDMSFEAGGETCDKGSAEFFPARQRFFAAMLSGKKTPLTR